MSLAAIVLHEAPCETRAAALDSDDRPVRLFMSRWNGEGEGARFGSFHEARLRSLSETPPGAFLELASGEEAFMRLRATGGLTEGEKIKVRVVSEARHGKLARAELVRSAGEAPENPLSSWLRKLPGEGAALKVHTGPDAALRVDAAFEDALNPVAPLPGGGTLSITPTPALVAIDVDSAGRTSKGSAAARALSINLDAVGESARQMALRDLGGALVIDCISPITREAGQKLRAGFREAFRRFSRREVKALLPSPFGLLEASLEWRSQPLHERVLEDHGRPTPETDLLSLFREAEREALAEPGSFFSLALCERLSRVYLGRKAMCDRALAERLSGRVAIETGSHTKARLKRMA